MRSTSGTTLTRRDRTSRAPFAVAFGFALATSSAIGSTLPAQPFSTTSVRQVAPEAPKDLTMRSSRTTSGLPLLTTPSVYSPASLAKRIAEIRALTGLTTDQVGRLFGVSRRSVHNWINGNAMAPQHEERAVRILSIVQVLPGTTPAERRAALLDSSRGTSLFHELVGSVRSPDEGVRLQGPGLTARERLGL